MGRRLRALLGKELREHWLALLLLLPLLGCGLLIVLASALVSARSASVLEAGLMFTITFVPITALALGHRLVVVEWHGRTQLFVEALPIRRWELVAVKYALGLLLLLGVAGAGLALSALLAARSEPLGARFLAIMAARSLVFTWCTWSFLFGMGFTGRYRVPLYVAMFLGLFALSRLTELDLAHFGPFELVSPQTWAGERLTFPVRALQVSAALAAGWTALAVVLATISEGSLAEVLSRSMSQKEKSVVGVLIVAALIAIGALDDRRQKEPYAFSDPAVLRSAGPHPLEILYGAPAGREDAQELLGALEADLAALARLLPAARLPVVRIAGKGSLDRFTFERAQLAENDGVLVRANLRRRAGATGDGWRALRAYVLRETLQEALDGRATFEPKRWLHDGFSRWFVERERGAPRGPLEPASSPPLLRALWATRDAPLTSDALRRWDPYREARGEPVAEGVAFSGLWALEQERGPEAVLALARGVFDRVVTRDARETWRELRDPPEVLVARTCGLPLDELVARWNARLQATREDPHVAALLDALPRGRAQVELLPGPGPLRGVRWGFELGRPLPRGTVVALVHCPLQPFDRDLDPHALLREERRLPEATAAGSWELPDRYTRGERAFLALELEVEALGGPLRLAAGRRTIE